MPGVLATAVMTAIGQYAFAARQMDAAAFASHHRVFYRTRPAVFAQPASPMPRQQVIDDHDRNYEQQEFQVLYASGTRVMASVSLPQAHALVEGARPR